ncbi:steroidogenic acute regulatory protein, mitochondrial [Megalops cyprinoides]|uniref:steroidogenic acute regulatory protein, mitochondrial n=1 Tax=Megalops cyprinoides TaxID=118141 RepID=UPI001865231C|nr:steroidogenic acute regulatory protein, mitochondrial [Megalops cyprinoides]
MLPAVVKLCCGISYPHLRSMAGLQRTAMAAIGQEIAHMKKGGQIILPDWTSHMKWPGSMACDETRMEKLKASRQTTLRGEELAYVKQGQEALQMALEIVEDKIGWKIETSEENGDVIYSKILPGARKVFKLEAVLDASPEELHEHLFVKVEDMSQWNPNIKQIKVLKQVGDDTMVTHEVSAETVGNLIGQRDFLSVRHCCKRKSCIYLAGAATHIESFPPQKGFVRAEDGPTCIIIQPTGDNTGKTRFTWLLNMDLKGWLPKSIVNQALPRAQADFTRHLRQHLAERLLSARG